MDVGNLIFCSSAFSKSSLNIWKFLIHVLSKPSLENFEHYFASMWNECSSVIVWTFFSTEMETDLFQSRGHCWVFQICWFMSTALSQHHLLGFEIAQLEFHHLVSIYHNINGNPKSRLPKIMLKSFLGKTVTLFFFFYTGIQALDNDSRSGLDSLVGAILFSADWIEFCPSVCQFLIWI